MQIDPLNNRKLRFRSEYPTVILADFIVVSGDEDFVGSICRLGENDDKLAIENVKMCKEIDSDDESFSKFMLECGDGDKMTIALSNEEQAKRFRGEIEMSCINGTLKCDLSMSLIERDSIMQEISDKIKSDEHNTDPHKGIRYKGLL